MSSEVLLAFAVVVFALMITGIVLSMREFVRISEDPSKKKGPDA